MSLHRLILETGFRQKWLAEQLSLGVSTFNEICHGRKGLTDAQALVLARAMRLPLIEILSASQATPIREPVDGKKAQGRVGE